MAKKEKNGCKKVVYVLGSVAMLGVACIVLPKVSRSIANSAYKASVKKKNENDDDDWEPEIVKKANDKVVSNGL